jgi:hypothetical protein
MQFSHDYNSRRSKLSSDREFRCSSFRPRVGATLPPLDLPSRWPKSTSRGSRPRLTTARTGKRKAAWQDAYVALAQETSPIFSYLNHSELFSRPPVQG